MSLLARIGGIFRRTRNVDFPSSTPIHKPSGSVIKRVVATELTAEDLRGSRLPETDFNIWLSLATLDAKLFRLIYSTDTKTYFDNPSHGAIYYPRLSVSSTDVNRKQFDEMLAYFTEINAGRPIPQRPTTEDEGYWGSNNKKRVVNISALIHDDKIPFTQKFIADMVEKYREKFPAVTIPVAYYSNVPKSAFLNPGFPQAKLTEEK